MTDKEKIQIIEILKDLPYPKKSAAYSIAEKKEVVNKVIELMRYKPVILQEHDAEPRRLNAILDTKTNGIYILETTKGFAESMGMTIEEVET